MANIFDSAIALLISFSKICPLKYEKEICDPVSMKILQSMCSSVEDPIHGVMYYLGQSEVYLGAFTYFEIVLPSLAWDVCSGRCTAALWVRRESV